MIQYKGAKWLKCDFHLHTPASHCFKDKSVTPGMWVQKCMDMHLDCVAVTDHNTGSWIDMIIGAAKGKPLVIFPGVEVTCDSAKIHLLVLFDRNATSQSVNDFLIACGINREDIGGTNTYVNKMCAEVINIAHEKGALVIPAHIDEFNGLGELAIGPINYIFKLPYVNAAQYVYHNFTGKELKDNEELMLAYNKFCSNPQPPIGLDRLTKYHNCVKSAVINNITLVTFSDNPDSEEPSKHGLAGIGKCYTWIKMDQYPSLESIRQAFIFPERVKNCFDSINCPYTEPELWIKAIEISDSALNAGGKPLKVEFNPQLNTIIGGRGSGKSSIFRFLRGAFRKMKDISDLSEIKEDQEKFFKKTDGDQGVLEDDTKIVVEFVRNSLLYQISYEKNSLVVRKMNNGSWELIQDDNYIDFFKFEQYTQKQIFAISKNANALLDMVDSSTEEITKLKNERRIARECYLEKKAEYATVLLNNSRISKLETEIADYKSRIAAFDKSNFVQITRDDAYYRERANDIKNMFTDAEQLVKQIINVANVYNVKELDLSVFRQEHKAEVSVITASIKKSVNSAVQGLLQHANVINQTIERENLQMRGTKFEKDKQNQYEKSDRIRKDLELKGIMDMSNYISLNKMLSEHENDKKQLERSVSKKAELENVIRELRKTIYDRTTEIRHARASILNKLSTDKVRVEIKEMSDSNKFIEAVRGILQRPNRYDSDFDLLKEKCFTGNPTLFLQNYENVLKDFNSMRYGKDSTLGFSGYMKNLFQDITTEQMSKLETLLPDDRIDIKYKPNGSLIFKSIINASAGQKTTAVLTFILSHGVVPLLLDQPEDDLDNRLVSDLIVEKIKSIKSNRQVIVITHNANIPVNGDAEYVISMDSSTSYLNIKAEGMVENSNVKKEICEIMEGGEDAFKRRAERYGNLVH